MRIVALALSASMHAAGHALIALLAGTIAVSLSRTWTSMGGRSSPLGDEGSLGERAFHLSMAALGVLVLKNAAGVYATYVQGQVAGEVGGALRLEVLDALLSFPSCRMPRHADHGAALSLAPTAPVAPLAPAVGVSALTQRIQDVEGGMEQGLLGGLRAAAQIVPLVGVQIALSPKMASVACSLLALFGLLLTRSRGGYRRAINDEARERERLLEAADESVRHADLWVSYGAEAKARAAVERLGRLIARRSASLRARAAALSGANEVLGAGALVLAIAASRAGWLGSVADGPTLLAFAVAFFLAYRPLREMAEARLSLVRADSAFGELRAFVEQVRVCEAAPGDAQESKGRSQWPAGYLEIRDLRLVRGRCGPVSFVAPPGAVVVVAGPTGIGKTTLLRTLLGFEPAAAGDVFYDGEALRAQPAGPAARPFAWVPQDAPLLSDTLQENVALGAASVKAADVLAPIGAGHLADALGTARLGPAGRSVSGGERQWIALARAIATRQPVLLLDEPTNGLDAAAQQQVLAAIGRLKGKRTVVMVTHRPEPLSVADLVVHL